MNFKTAKKIYDKLANPKIYRFDTCDWVELIYSPVDGDPDGDDEVLYSWELTEQEKYLVELSRMMKR